jgi:hypothetical protein
MSRMIPALKCPPELVPELVSILYDCASNREEIDRRMTKSLRRISRASQRNLLRAYAAPTLNNLGLAEGEGRSWRCSPDGVSLALAWKDGEAVGIRRFGYLLYQCDDKNGLRVIQELQKAKADRRPSSRRILGESLFERYQPEFDQTMSLKVLLDRLGKWLGYLAYVRFVSYVEGDYIRLFPFEVQASLGEQNRSWKPNEFKKGLIAAYESLRRENPSMIYVPIPDLRQRMYEKMFKPYGLTFSSVVFDDALRKLPKATEKYVILLSPPGSQSGGGIRIGEKYFYYISIHRHKREK